MIGRSRCRSRATTQTGGRRRHGGLAAGAGAGRASAGAGRTGIRPCRSASVRPLRRSPQFHGANRPGESQARPGVCSISRMTIVTGAAGWLDHQAQCRGRHLCDARPADFLAGLAAGLGDGELTRKASSPQMRAGQPVTISVDAYPDLKLKGHVDSIQLGTGSRFTAFPPENATGNFVKIVQRVPVKIDIDSGLDPKLPLSLGLSVVPSVKVQ